MVACLALIVGLTACEKAIAPSEAEVVTITSPSPDYARNPKADKGGTEISGEGAVVVGNSIQLVAKDQAGNALVARWSSSAPKVASVSAEGMVKGVAAGEATITAKVKSKQATALIRVTAPQAETPPEEPAPQPTPEPAPAPVVASVAVSPATAEIDVGGTTRLTATVKDSVGNALTGRAVTWSSSSTAVATVSAEGVVTGSAAGVATITATSEGRSGSAAVTVKAVAPAPSPAPAVAGIWIGSKEVAALPMSGSAWQNLKAQADRSCGTLDLANQNQDNNVCIMAKALVFARTGTESYRSDVGAALRTIVNSGTYSGRALALGRELAAYVIAADLIALSSYDAALDQAFRTKLRELLRTPTTGGPSNLIDCHEARPNNWGTHCGASRAAVAAYLGDRAELDRTARVFKGWLGDRSSYAGFKFGDLSWQCNAAAPVAINPAGCTKEGNLIDGVLPDDQRRGGAFTWPAPKENYVWEALQGAIAQARILQRQGYDAFNWQDRALLRAVTWLHQQAAFPASGDDTWMPHVINAVYGTLFPAPVPASPGKNVGWTDWTR